MALVNGQAWPKLDVEQRKYRLRLLNGSDSRFYDLRFEVFKKDSQITPGKGAPVPILVIGNGSGCSTNRSCRPWTPRSAACGPTSPNVLPIGPGERYDVIVDFTNVPIGSRVVVTNSAKSPYPDAVRPANKLLDRVMAFDVISAAAGIDATVDIGTDLRAADLLPATIPDGTPVRRILLFEGVDQFGRLMTMLGTVDPVTAADGTTQQGTLVYKDPITELPEEGTTEIWEFYNTPRWTPTPSTCTWWISASSTARPSPAC